MERPSGLRDMRVEEVKGRNRRVRKLGIVEAIMRARMERMRVLRSFSLKDIGGLMELGEVLCLFVILKLRIELSLTSIR